MAEALLRDRLHDSGIVVCSAGIAALVNHPADPLAQLVMQEHGFDIAAHRAQQATQPLLSAMDLILTLDQTHSEWVRLRYPQLQGRTHKLGRWPKNLDISDPYRLPRAAFDQAYEDIERGTSEWVQRIKP